MSSNQQIPKTTFKDIASTNIYFCYENDNVATIAQLMRDNWTDTIFVKNDKDKVTGIITDGIIWDLIAKERGEKDPRSYRAKEIMYKNFIRVDCSTPIGSIDQLRELFDKTPIQRIGLEKNGVIVGLVRRKFIERVKRYSRNFSFELK
ncbi:MAG: CBS domain-containing protein [Promethearchaeota archaeon]|nr:MAG: CBS domain-containing protein [Candidatus Lokiarchaeota archaeon]